MDIRGGVRRAALAAVVTALGVGLVLPATAGGVLDAAGNGFEAHGNGEANEARAQNLAALEEAGGPQVQRPQREVQQRRISDGLVLEGRTKKRSTKVNVLRWKPRAKQWKLVERTRSRKHTYKVRVTNKRALAAPKLKVKPRKERAAVVQLTDACGARPTKADGSLWSCTFADEFDGDSLDRSTWVPQTAGYTTGDKTNFACYRDDPSNVSVGDGVLRLTLRQEEDAAPCVGLKGSPSTRFTSGSVSTYHTFSQQYGRFEARTRNTAADVAGLHEAFWLWPDDRYSSTATWPLSGEIDIAETYSLHPTVAIPYLHYLAWGAVLTGKNANTAWTCAAKRGEWNTWTLEWTASRIDVFVNGTRCLTNTSGSAAFRKRYIMAFTQGIGGSPNTWSARTPTPATYEVDWVRVWQ